MKKPYNLIFVFSLFLLIPYFTLSQIPQKIFIEDSFTAKKILLLKEEFGKHKTIPPSIEKPVLIALSYYPELKNTSILFRIKKRHTPLQTRSTWTGLFKRKKI